MPTFSSPAVEQGISLADGRRLTFLQDGPSTGTPVFYFPSTPGSRLEGAFLAASSATELGIRFISLDRPGIGQSDFQPQRRLLDWPDDVAAVADALGIARFAVAGVSSGTAYVAACARLIPHRLTACGIISGMGPTGSLPLDGMPLSSRATWWLFQRLPWLVKGLVKQMAHASQDEASGEQWLLRQTKRLPEPDQKVFLDPEMRKQAMMVWRDGFRQGIQGVFEDLRLVYAADWGFKLQDLVDARVFLWHGEEDRNVPLRMARAMEQALPHCRAQFVPNEGHTSLAVNHITTILRALGEHA